jgi:low affinity Fe/Cu permease
MKIKPLFTQFARWTAHKSGHPFTFIGAVAIIIAWAVCGPFFGWSDTWQLIINTGTTIITFLMVFLIQNTQNSDTEAINLKLDELIRATQEARNTLISLEDLSDEDLDRLKAEFDRRADKARRQEAGPTP